MPIHHSNPKCDTCGYRHSPENDSECLDCVLSQSAEDIAERDAEILRLQAELKRTEPKRRRRAMANLEREKQAWIAGYRRALCHYAHWDDGIQYVGTTGRTLAEAEAERVKADILFGDIAAEALWAEIERYTDDAN